MITARKVATTATLTAALLLAATATANAATYSFACKTPRFFGSAPCGSPFTVHANEIVRVNLVSSGGHEVLFSGYVEDDEVGETGYLHPGAAETVLWQNNRGHDVTMEVYARTASDDHIEVLAQGNYRVEP